MLVLRASFVECMINVVTLTIRYAIFDCMSEQLHRERLQIVKVQNKVGSYDNNINC